MLKAAIKVGPADHGRRVGGRWRERIIRPGEIYKTRLFPGLQFPCDLVFQAAKSVQD